MTKVEPSQHKCYRCCSILPPLDKVSSAICPSCCDRQFPEQALLGTGVATRTATMLHGGPPVMVQFTQLRPHGQDAKITDPWCFDIVDERIQAGRHYDANFAAHWAEEAAWRYVAQVIGPIIRWS